MEQIPKEISKQADRDIHQVALIKTNLALDYTGLCILLIIWKETLGERKRLLISRGFGIGIIKLSRIVKNILSSLCERNIFYEFLKYNHHFALL